MAAGSLLIGVPLGILVAAMPSWKGDDEVCSHRWGICPADYRDHRSAGNEFAFDWGRCTTLTFAGMSILGLATLVLTHLGAGRTRKT